MRTGRLPKTPTYTEYQSDSSYEGAVERVKERIKKRKIRVTDLISSDNEGSPIHPQKIQKQLLFDGNLKNFQLNKKGAQVIAKPAAATQPKQPILRSSPPSPASTVSSSSDDDEAELPPPISDSRYEKVAKENIPILYIPKYLKDPNSLENDPDFFGFLPPQTLRVGDVIEFTAVEGTAGDARWDRKAEILGFKPKHQEYPLVLDPMHFLPRSHRVRRTASEDVPVSGLRSIDQFVFIGEQGEQNSAAAFIEAGKKARQVKADVEKAANDWWKNSSKNTKTNSSTSVEDDDLGSWDC